MLVTPLLLAFVLASESVSGIQKRRNKPRKIVRVVSEETFDPLPGNNTACELFAKDAHFDGNRALGDWTLVYASLSLDERCRGMELARTSYVEAVGWVNAVRGLLVGVRTRLATIKYKLWNLFGGGSVLLQEAFSPGAMVFLPSAATLRARPMAPGMTLELQFKEAREYGFISFMMCDTESVYLLAKRYEESDAVREVARELGLPRGRVLCDRRKTPQQRRMLPMRYMKRND